MILDGADGRVARWTNTQSDFGAEFDSLADMVSFGVAPALIVYLWALNDLASLGWKSSMDHWNDDAVWTLGDEPYQGLWGELRYPPGHPQHPESIDLAFVIGGGEPPLERPRGPRGPQRPAGDRDWSCCSHRTSSDRTVARPPIGTSDHHRGSAPARRRCGPGRVQ